MGEVSGVNKLYHSRFGASLISEVGGLGEKRGVVVQKVPSWVLGGVVGDCFDGILDNRGQRCGRQLMDRRK